MSGAPPPGPGGGGFNPGAFEFRPGHQQPFVPRGQQQYQQQQQAYDPYGAYGQQGQGGYYNQYGAGGGYPQYGQGQGQQGYYPQQQQGYVPPQQRTYQPPAARNVQGFQPPNLPPTSSSPEPRTLNTSAPKPAPSLSIGGGAPKAAPSLSIGGAPKAAPSLSIGGGGGGGAPKSAPSLKIGGGGGAPVSLSIGGKKSTPAAEKKVEEKDGAPAPTPAKPSTPKPAETASVPEPTPVAAASESKADPAPADDVPAPQAAASDAQAKVVASSGAATPTNFSKVTAKNDADAIAKEQAAAGAEALRDLYGDDVKDTNVKSHLNIIFTGHVDAGKSTMGGQLMFLTGAVDKRTMEKYEQEAKAAGRDTWYLSWALDSNKEERAKGKTIEVGRAYFESEKRRYTILDAPGHKTYVPNMITGAAQADVAILVLSARKGEFETGFEREGQTREHAMLIKNNGINKLIIVVNKMDDVTVQWDKERFDDICRKITPFLKSVGFNPKTDITFIPVSAQMGQNMAVRVGKELASWYDGPALLEYLDNMAIEDRNIESPLVLPISEKYNDLGAVIVGKVEAGRLKKGDSLIVMPNKSNVEVAGVYTEQGDELQMAFAGDNVRVRLNGVSDKDLQPGYVVCSVQKPIKAVTSFKADISVIESKNIICGGYSAVLHVHTLAEEVTITALLNYFDKKTRKRSKKPPQFAKQGMMCRVLLTTSQPVCILPYSESKVLGRLSLRDEGRTIAIGKCISLIQSDEEMPDVAGLSVKAA